MKFKKKFGIGIAALLVFVVVAMNFGNKVFVKAAGTDDYVVGTVNLNNTTDNSAKIGNQLLNPEKGWKRYNDTNTSINYNSVFGIYSNDSRGYLNDFHGMSIYNDKIGEIKFNFTGTMLRLVIYAENNSDYDTKAKITIDGQTETFSTLNNTSQKCTLVYEKLGLSNTEHSVVINNSATGRAIIFDATDIDENGSLKPYNANPVQEVKATSITLNPTSLDMLVGDQSSITATVLPENATNKTVTWSSDNEGVAKVDPNTGAVTAVGEGQAVITAKVVGTDLTATCVVKVTKPADPTTGNAILSITLVNGSTKEYDVSMTEINKFTSWYETRTQGTGSNLYAFSKKISPYKDVKEYIAQDKIASFEVRQYDSTTN